MTRISDALIQKIAICLRYQTNTDPEQGIEGSAHVPPPVPAAFKPVPP